METGIAILKREPIRIPDTPAELLGEVPQTRRSLAEKASRVLGYKPLLQSLEALKTAKPGVEARIADLFDRLGIVPFTPESVAAYQEQERQRVRTWKQKWPDVFGAVLTITFLSALIVLIGTGIAWGVGKPLPGLASSMGLTALLSSIAGTIMGANAARFRDWEWRSVPINEYKEPVPEAALEMAIVLNQAWPQSVIEIEHLSWGPRTSDPFLVFKVEEREFKKRYYVGVWAEPNFQAEFR